jgi:hypothetical protein
LSLFDTDAADIPADGGAVPAREEFRLTTVIHRLPDDRTDSNVQSNDTMRRWEMLLATLGVIFAVTALTAGATGVVLLAVQSMRATSGQVQWGTVAQWASAAATGLGFFAGVLVIRRDNRLRRGAERQQREAEHRKQAERITGYWDNEAQQYVLINGSSGSAYMVGVVIEFMLDAHPLAGTVHIDFAGEPILPPRGEKRIEGVLRPSGEPCERRQIVNARLDVLFTDQAGVHWRRDKHGVLAGIDQTPRQFLEFTGREQIELNKIAAERERAVAADDLARGPIQRLVSVDPGVVSQPGTPPATEAVWSIRRSSEDRYEFALVLFGAAGKIQILGNAEGYIIIPPRQPFIDGKSFEVELPPGEYTIKWRRSHRAPYTDFSVEFTVPFDEEVLELSV